MPRRKALKGVMHSFLRSFTSRYSDYDGYWIFGLVTCELNKLTINLMDVENTTNNEVVLFPAQLGQREFKEQTDKAKLPMHFVRQAQMNVSQSTATTKGFVAGHLCTGHIYTFSIQVISDLGRPFRATTHKFIAPHNPAVEHRSTRRI